MNGIYEKMEITETNIEEMSQLAEDVMHQLYMNYQDYDADGRDIFGKYYSTERDYKKDIHPLIRAENAERKYFAISSFIGTPILP